MSRVTHILGQTLCSALTSPVLQEQRAQAMRSYRRLLWGQLFCSSWPFFPAVCSFSFNITAPVGIGSGEGYLQLEGISRSGSSLKGEG